MLQIFNNYTCINVDFPLIRVRVWLPMQRRNASAKII